MSQRTYKIAAAYDTETTTVGKGPDSRAFAYAYIFNDLRNVAMSAYQLGVSDNISIYRHEYEAAAFIEELIATAPADIIPVVAAYNMLFDMQTIIADLCERYEMTCSAQTSTHVYVLDLLDDSGTVRLRFWDTFFLDMAGLRSMGETAGVPKAMGDLDYSKCRHQGTPLTERELFYMRRDVQIIPAYLRWLLDAHPWMSEADFGFKVMTKTSVVRQMALHQIWNFRTPGKRFRIGNLFEKVCAEELPPDYQTMALRTACFRGGLTFTAARTAYVTVHNVGSWDVTSMHHQYINGRRVPVHFGKRTPEQLRLLALAVRNTPLSHVLSHYDIPFGIFFHAMFAFTNLRLKKDSAFEFYGIATLAEGKFTKKNAAEDAGDDAVVQTEANIAIDEALKSRGWIDEARGATFAFGKLYAAQHCYVCLSEVEFWNVCQVYDFDEFDVIGGEATSRTIVPPDYVTLQSNMLFEQKSHVKYIVNTYEPGVPYTENIPSDIPDNIAAGLRAGTVTASFLKGYYNIATKGAFNGIYGCQAMQLWRPDYKVERDGTIHLDSSTMPDDDNFDEMAPETPRVLYTYGLRIVGGSRQHLVIAIMLIYEAFGGRALVTGGDTDSLKIALAPDVTPEMITQALEPLHAACRAAKAAAMLRVRRNFPDVASTLDKIGEFDFEPASKTQALYDDHMELWNKARVSRAGSETHVTLAGVSRPDKPNCFEGACYNIEHVMNELQAHGHTFDETVKSCLGYNAYLAPNVGHALMRTRPAPTDMFDDDVTDYRGETVHVRCHAAQALYPISKVLGDTSKFSNAATIDYMRRKYGREVDTRDKFVCVTAAGAHAHVEIGNASPDILE